MDNITDNVISSNELSLYIAAIYTGPMISVLTIKGATDFNDIISDYVSSFLQEREFNPETIETIRYVLPAALLGAALAVSAVAYVQINISAALITLGLIASPLALNGIKAFYLENGNSNTAPSKNESANLPEKSDPLNDPQKINAKENREKCFENFQKETGAKLIITDSSLTIEISDPQVSFEELSEKITALSKLHKGKIEIACTPKSSDSLDAIKKFLETHGQSIRSLDIIMSSHP